MNGATWDIHYALPQQFCWKCMLEVTFMMTSVLLIKWPLPTHIADVYFWIMACPLQKEPAIASGWSLVKTSSRVTLIIHQMFINNACNNCIRWMASGAVRVTRAIQVEMTVHSRILWCVLMAWKLQRWAVYKLAENYRKFCQNVTPYM